MPLKRKYGDQNPYKTLSRPTKMLKRSPKMASYRRRSLLRAAGILGIETKYLDVWASSLAVPANDTCESGEMQPEGGCTECLSAPAQGDGPQARDGRQIQFKGIFIDGFVNLVPLADQADVATPQTVFVALVLDTQTNGSTIVSEQVFTNPNDTPVVNGYPLRNLAYSTRYKVLAHKTIHMGPVTAGTDGANTNSLNGAGQCFTLGYKGDMPIKFGSLGTATVSDVIDNSLHLVAFACSSAWTTTISYNSRMRFRG